MEQPRLDKLSNFIKDEMNARSLNAKEFAKFINAEPSQITRILKGEYKEAPKLLFLAKLAGATHIDLCSIVALLYPGLTTVNAEAAIIANRITQLPAERIELFDDFILWLANQKGGEGGNKRGRLDDESTD